MADVVESLEAWVNEQAPKILAMYRFDTDDDLRRARESFDILRVRLPNDLSLRARLSQAGAGVGVREALEAAYDFLGGVDSASEVRDKLLSALAPSPSAGEPVAEAWRWTCRGDTQPFLRLSGAPLSIAGDVIAVKPLYATPPATPVQPTASVETVDEPEQTFDEGIDFALGQLCVFLGVDETSVTWDAATETLDGDVRSVIGNILRAKFGEDWSPASLTPAPTQGVVIDLHKADWGAIEQAATESSWMPPEYTRNDWVSDVCRFLREGPEAFTTPSSPVSAPSPAGGANPAAMTERLIDAAIYNEQASGAYTDGARRELNEARAAIERALSARPHGAVMDELDHAYRLEQETPEGGAVKGAAR